LHIANLATDGQIIQLARDAAEQLLDSDPELVRSENRVFATTLQLTTNRKIDWSKIS
jgi:ATP-dependent DNA helicase RecG